MDELLFFACQERKICLAATVKFQQAGAGDCDTMGRIFGKISVFYKGI